MPRPESPAARALRLAQAALREAEVARLRALDAPTRETRDVWLDKLRERAGEACRQLEIAGACVQTLAPLEVVRHGG